MQPLRRIGMRALRRFGVAGTLAIALCAAAASIALWLPRLQQHAEALRVAVAAQTAAVARREQAAPRAPSSGEQLNAFIARLPALSQNAADLEQVFACAKRRNVVLAKGEYQLKVEPTAALITYTAAFPVRHGYSALKLFTADVLETLPHVSLDELRMSRSDAGTGALDAVVRFTFVYRGP